MHRVSARDVHIRRETPADVAAIRVVTEAAFRDAPHSDQREAAIVDALRRAGALSISLVADHGGKLIGHAAASPVTIDGRAGDWFGMGPVSVQPDWQRCGIGSLLVQALLKALREQGAGGCVVLGDPDYYRRFGFRVDATLKLPDVPPEYFQSLRLSGSSPAGIVAYHAGFHV